VIGQVASHYRILERLGGGGMGIVYKAQDLKLDRPVALKFLPSDLTRDTETKERFVHEARAASSLQHANICVVHDIDETSDAPAQKARRPGHRCSSAWSTWKAKTSGRRSSGAR